MKVNSPLDNLAGAGGPLAAEPPDRNEFNGLKKSGLARLHDAANATLSLDSEQQGAGVVQAGKGGFR